MRLVDADELIADCQLAQKQADRHGREFANAFYSDGGEISTEWWCVEDMIENAPTIEQRKNGKWIPVTNGRGGHECNQCHNYAPAWQTGEERLTDFCPCCGADMRGEQDDRT